MFERLILLLACEAIVFASGGIAFGMLRALAFAAWTLVCFSAGLTSLLVALGMIVKLLN
jgi:hypothetical protein